MLELIDSAVPIITILIAIVATVFVFSGIDDLLMDVFYVVWRVFRRPAFNRKHRPLTREMLLAEPQRPIAVMIPTWREDKVIRATLLRAIEKIQYDEYTIFVGVYPNDPATRAEVEGARTLYPERIRIVEVGHDGPTTKADCLNAIIANAFALEQTTGKPFEIFVLDDAEDAIPRYGFLVFNHLVPRKDFVQLPVFPEKVRWWKFTAGHYMDEFAQLHLKDMRTREWLTGVIPSAGVGAAFSRRAMLLAAEVNHGKVFSEDTLTEDYELPLQLVRMKANEAFVEPGKPVYSEHPDIAPEVTVDEEYPYIRSAFPEKLRAAVRQKTRWVLGISLQGWEHLGWRGGGAMHSYMLWRDRKVLFGNLANFAGYILVVFTLGLWITRWQITDDQTFPNVVPEGTLVWYLLIINFFIMLIQLIVRFACTLTIYGLIHAVLSIPRAVWGNFINFLATTRALLFYFRARKRHEPIPWDKTEHTPSELN